MFFLSSEERRIVLLLCHTVLCSRKLLNGHVHVFVYSYVSYFYLNCDMVLSFFTFLLKNHQYLCFTLFLYVLVGVQLFQGPEVKSDFKLSLDGCHWMLYFLQSLFASRLHTPTNMHMYVCVRFWYVYLFLLFCASNLWVCMCVFSINNNLHLILKFVEKIIHLRLIMPISRFIFDDGSCYVDYARASHACTCTFAVASSIAIYI